MALAIIRIDDKYKKFIFLYNKRKQIGIYQNMKYRLPTLKDKEILSKYVQEHFDNGENSISASFGLSKIEYSEWVKTINKYASIGEKDLGKNLLYLCFDNDELIGLLSIRYDLSEKLREDYGDIGYGVRPSKRNKGYATEMCRYGLSVCKEKGMKEVIIGCYKDNVASATVIKNNGGVLLSENHNHNENRLSQYYSIKL